MVILSVILKYGELLISAVSLIIAIFALYKSSKAEKLQAQLNKMELQLKKYELEKIDAEKRDALLSCVEARVVKIGKGRYKMKIWNSGNTVAYDVTANFVGNPNIIISDEKKQPFEILEPKKNYELNLLVHCGSARKFCVKTEWKDENGVYKSKECLETI